MRSTFVLCLLAVVVLIATFIIIGSSEGDDGAEQQEQIVRLKNCKMFVGVAKDIRTGKHTIMTRNFRDGDYLQEREVDFPGYGKVTLIESCRFSETKEN